MAHEALIPRQIEGLEGEIQKVADILTALGIAANATNFGALTSSNLPDNANLVTILEAVSDALNALGTTEHQGADITARNGLTDLVAGDKVFVTDASAQSDVNSGWAIYRYQGGGTSGSYVDGDFVKMAEQESLDVSIIPTFVSETLTLAANTALDTAFNLPAAANNIALVDTLTFRGHCWLEAINSVTTNVINVTVGYATETGDPVFVRYIQS